jgi:hypothetical protein
MEGEALGVNAAALVSDSFRDFCSGPALWNPCRTDGLFRSDEMESKRAVPKTVS